MMKSIATLFLGLVLGFAIAIILSINGLVSFANYGEYSIKTEVPKEKLAELSAALTEFNHKKVLLSDRIDLYIRCPSSDNVESCEIGFDRNQ